jgi:hypothetical protein
LYGIVKFASWCDLNNRKKLYPQGYKK